MILVPVVLIAFIMSSCVPPLFILHLTTFSTWRWRQRRGLGYNEFDGLDTFATVSIVQLLYGLIVV